MSTPAEFIREAEAARTRGGPRTEEGKATSSKNAVTDGLFTATDFIRPNELIAYNKLAESLNLELAPETPLELYLADEIRRALWRLRRCGQVESNLVVRLNDNPVRILDPMETANPNAERIQKSVDRARSQAHRLLHKCTAELRKLQTERIFRCEFFDDPVDAVDLGLCDVRAVRKGIDEQPSANLRPRKVTQPDATQPTEPSAQTTSAPESSFCKQTPRNADCPCGSGQKYKRCCGKGAPAVLHAA
jgi:hypothetical protein